MSKRIKSYQSPISALYLAITVASSFFVPNAFAQNIQLPAEPLAPTEEQQCKDLQRGYHSVISSVKSRINSCTESMHRSNGGPGGKMGVVGNGSCGSWTYKKCAGMVQQCDKINAKRDNAVSTCRAKVRLAKSSEKKARNAAINYADKSVLGIKNATNTLTKNKNRAANVKEAYDFITGKQSDSQKIDFIGKSAKGAYSAGNSNSLAKRNFDDAINRLSALHKENLRDFDSSIQETSTIGRSLTSAATYRANSPNDYSKLQALREEIIRNSEYQTLKEIKEANRLRKKQLKIETERARRIAEQSRRREQREEDEYWERRRIQQEREELEDEEWRRSRQNAYVDPLAPLNNAIQQRARQIQQDYRRRQLESNTSYRGRGSDDCAGRKQRGLSDCKTR